MEDESYLNKRGLTHFWENIDDIKQNKLTAGAGISITNDVISATGGGTADAVDWGHITGSMSNQTDLTTALAAKANSADLATVATSGDYDDLSNKPTIGNATLTIQKNGTSAGTFTANATSNKTINITVPTTAADVSALPASTKYGATLTASINTTTYVMTLTLKDQDGNTLGTAQTVDLPLESMVVNGSYDSTNKKIVLTLQSGSTIDIPVADLVAGLQSEITSTNKLASDLVDDTNQTHKFMTSAEKTKLSGIAAGAEVNVQSDWDQTTTTADDYIKNKPSIPTKTSDLTNDSNFVSDANYVHTDNNYTTTEKNKLSGIAAGAEVNVQANWTQTTTTADDYIKNKPTLATVATSGSYNDLSNKPTIPAAQVNSDWDAVSGVAQILNKPTLATVATSGSYNDLSNKPTIPTVNNATLTIQKNGTNVQTFTANQSTNATANITVPTNTSDLNNDSGYLTSATAVTSFNGSTGAVTYTAPVTSVNGDTGAVTVSKLARAGLNVSPSSDIPSAWATSLPEGESWVWYNTASCFTNQPSRYGHLETIRNGGEVYQRWHEQSAGVTYYRAGNSTGWWGQSGGSGAFRKIIDNGQSATVTSNMIDWSTMTPYWKVVATSNTNTVTIPLNYKLYRIRLVGYKNNNYWGVIGCSQATGTTWIYIQGTSVGNWIQAERSVTASSDKAIMDGARHGTPAGVQVWDIALSRSTTSSIDFYATWETMTSGSNTFNVGRSIFNLSSGTGTMTLYNDLASSITWCVEALVES